MQKIFSVSFGESVQSIANIAIQRGYKIDHIVVDPTGRESFIVATELPALIAPEPVTEIKTPLKVPTKGNKKNER